MLIIKEEQANFFPGFQKKRISFMYSSFYSLINLMELLSCSGLEGTNSLLNLSTSVIISSFTLRNERNFQGFIFSLFFLIK